MCIVGNAHGHTSSNFRLGCLHFTWTLGKISIQQYSFQLWLNSKTDCVIYWPSTEPSIKRYSSVNKRKNSRSRWILDYNITRCPDGSRQSETGCRSEKQLQTESSGPSLTHGWATPSQDEKEVLLWSREEFAVNIAVRPCLHSFLTHNKHHPFENKVWKNYIFIKRCIHSFVEVVIISWLCSRIY